MRQLLAGQGRVSTAASEVGGETDMNAMMRFSAHRPYHDGFTPDPKQGRRSKGIRTTWRCQRVPPHRSVQKLSAAW